MGEEQPAFRELACWLRPEPSFRALGPTEDGQEQRIPYMVGASTTREVAKWSHDPLNLSQQGRTMDSLQPILRLLHECGIVIGQRKPGLGFHDGAEARRESPVT